MPSFWHLQAYEKQKNEKKAEMAELSKAAKESQVKSFLDKELSIVSKPLNPFDRQSGKSGRQAILSNWWWKGEISYLPSTDRNNKNGFVLLLCIILCKF